MLFQDLFADSNIVLTEGAIVERLKSEFKVTLDRYVNHAALVYSKPEILAEIYSGYINIAEEYDLPIMLMTPTRKVNFETVNKSIYKGKNLIADNCGLLFGARNKYPEFAERIAIGGLMGCRGDAYNASEALSTNEAYKFHKVQADLFKAEKPDFLFAGIMPALTEAVGMAQAMSELGIPYIISFMVRKTGELLDGTSISEAIRIIDAETSPTPVCYMANCIHPANLRLALSNKLNINSPYIKRFYGIQANASPLSPEELNNCGVLQQSNFDEMVDEMNILHKEFGLKILGGCCGTDGVFIRKLAEKIVNI